MFYSSSAIVSAWWELQHFAVQHQTIPKRNAKKKKKKKNDEYANDHNR